MTNSTNDPIPAAEAAAERLIRCATHVRELDTSVSDACAAQNESDAASIRAVTSELTQAREINRRSCSDWAETDTHIRALCRPLLGEFVDGDSHAVPAIEDLVECVCSELTKARERIAELERTAPPGSVSDGL